MASKNPSEIVAYLRLPSVRLRSALWLIPLTDMGQEGNEAARLRIDASDLRSMLLDGLPPASRFAGLSPHKVLGLLQQVAQTSGNSDVVLTYNLDPLMAFLTQSDRKGVWDGLFHLPYQRRALLVAMPVTAEELLPEKQVLILLAQQTRLAGEHPSLIEGAPDED